MFMMPDVSPLRSYVYTRHIDVPSVDEVSFRHRVQHTGINSIAINDLHLGESYSLFESRRCRDA